MLKTGTSFTTGNGIEIPEHGSGSELHFRTTIKQVEGSMGDENNK